MKKLANILLIGAGGSGKGTIASELVKKYGLNHISMGDVLRRSKNHHITNTIKKGLLVPDSIAFDELELHLQTLNILDGFPRTTDQLHAMLKRKWSILTVLTIELPDDVILDRLQHRRIHPMSGRIYHLKFSPPKTPGVDDFTQEALVQRADDQPHIIKKRLKIYRDITYPILEECRALHIPVHSFENPTSEQNYIEMCTILDKLLNK